MHFDYDSYLKGFMMVFDHLTIGNPDKPNALMVADHQTIGTKKRQQMQKAPDFECQGQP